MPTALRSPVMPSFISTSPRAMSKAPMRMPSASSWTRDVSPARIGTASWSVSRLSWNRFRSGIGSSNHW